MQNVFMERKEKIQIVIQRVKRREIVHIKIRKVCSSVFKAHLHVKELVLTRKGHSNNHMGYVQSKGQSNSLNSHKSINHFYYHICFVPIVAIVTL